jgi:hypothetical protein
MDAATAWGFSKHSLKHHGNWSRGIRQGYICDVPEEGKREGARVWSDPMKIFLATEGPYPQP